MSEGLEVLEELRKETRKGGQYYIIKSEKRRLLSIVEKKLKALEIINPFLKAIGLDFIFWNEEKRAILITDNNEFEYWYYCKTQEEYDLLKEVLL